MAKARPKYTLIWRWIDKEDEEYDREPEFKELENDYETDQEDQEETYGMRLEHAVKMGYRVFYVQDAVLLRVNEHWVADLAETDAAKWLILDDEDKGYAWGGDSIITRADVYPSDFIIKMSHNHAP